MHIWVSQNNYGHWRAILVGADVIAPESSPSQATREAAIAYARERWPALDVVFDGRTENADPPPLPKIDATAEARAAGIAVG